MKFLTDMVGEKYRSTLGPLAEDYLQDLKLDVIQAIRNRKVEHPQFLVTYCKTVAANIRIDGLRSAAGAARRLVPIEEGKNRQSSGNFENELIMAERLQSVLKIVEQLDPVLKRIIRRYYFELVHLNPSKRAERIQREERLTPNQFRERKARAVRKLRDDYQAMAQRWRTISGGRKPVRPPVGWETSGLRAA